MSVRAGKSYLVYHPVVIKDEGNEHWHWQQDQIGLPFDSRISQQFDKKYDAESAKKEDKVRWSAWS